MILKVIFVDDEPRLLDGLKRALRSMREKWDMRFANNGPEALEMMEVDPADVIVTDMRMPGMDGAELLARIRDRWPHVVRIILSGHSDNKADIKATRPAHQYLSKPCDTECLKSTISRALALRDLLSNEKLKGAISRIDSLPSIPQLYHEINRELQSEDPSLERVGEIVSQDIGMTAKILQLVNSAFFGIPKRVSNPMEAVTLLGLENLQVLVISAHIFRELHTEEIPEGFAERLWMHSMRTGFIAKKIAISENMDRFQVDDAFLAGVLHDAGRLILACNFPTRYKEILQDRACEGDSLIDTEKRIFGASHSEVGGYLMGLWGMPDGVVETLVFHHHPQEAPSTGLEPVGVVAAADFLDTIRESEGGEMSAPEHLAQYLQGINMKDHLRVWGRLLDQGV
jgi:HD-like signal output (HDOD) protein